MFVESFGDTMLDCHGFCCCVEFLARATLSASRLLRVFVFWQITSMYMCVCVICM